MPSHSLCALTLILLGGTCLPDNACHAERKVIRQLRINSGGTRIDGLVLDFTDGTSTGWRGTETASPHVFTLNSGEDFTHIFATTDGKCITALQLATSKGRSTPWYGTQTGAVTGWELEGRALAGFVGAASSYVTGLMPLWSERYSTASLTNLQSCVTEGEHIRKENELASMRCEQLKSLAEDLRYNIDTGLRAPAEHAVQGLVTLSGSVEGLYNKTHEPGPAQPEETKKLLKLCKGQAVVVANRFQSLYEQSRTIMNQSGELSTELTAKLGESEARMTRLSNLQVVSDGLKKGAEATAQIMRDNEQTALISIQNAERTRKEAEGKRKDAQIGRAIRDIFTLGLGRLGDWFNLDQAVDYAEKLVESCGRLLQQSRDDLQRAQQAVQRINSEIGGFGNLAGVLVGYRGVLQDTAARGIVLRERTIALTNHALDVSRFLAGLAAKSETVRTKLTAAQLAKAILAVEGLIGPQAKVKGLLGYGTERLDGTLEMIATSDAVADEVKDLI
ncbi:hypothetical protein BDW22DRAFT_625269 [Trametopsis cervina]|nr:hypothetical protein BDW22DRAFT_625269 [Trametopsis cervina]